MNKKLLAIMMSGLLCVTPVYVQATETEAWTDSVEISETEETVQEESMEIENKTIETEEVQNEETQNLRPTISIGGVLVTEENEGDVLGDGTVAYDSVNNQLILNNVVIDTALNYGLNVDGDLNIVLVGDNSISNAGVCGIRATGSIVLMGNGTLNVFGLDYGIYVRQNLTICESVTINAASGDITDGDNFAIYAGYDYTSQIVISGDAEVYVTGGYAPNYSYGIYSDDNLTVCENAAVVTCGGEGFDRSCGMYAISNIWIKDNAQVQTSGANTQAMENDFNDSYGIRTTQLYVYGGSLTSIGGDTNALSSGIFTQVMEVTGGSVFSQGGNVAEGPSNGLQVTTDLILSGGSIEAEAGDAQGDASSGILIGNMNVSGGSLLASSKTGMDTFGIMAEECTVSGGDIEAVAMEATNVGRGFQVLGDMTFSDGNIQVYVKDAENKIFGLQTSGTMHLHGGEISVVTEMAPKSNAVYAFEKMDIDGCRLTVQTEGNGLYSPYGIICIGSTEAAARDNSAALKDTYVSLTTGEHAIYAGAELTISDNILFDKDMDVQVVSMGEGEEMYWTIVDGADQSVLKAVVMSTNPEDLSASDVPETDAPETDAPETDAPETDAPETNAPETNAPETSQTENKPTQTPGTGDSTPLMLLMSIMAASFMFIEGMLVYWKMQKRK